VSRARFPTVLCGNRGFWNLSYAADVGDACTYHRRPPEA